jgi:EAL domain-containing protein (putative c-di-GMP-specific phosphodiesterase class I)
MAKSVSRDANPPARRPPRHELRQAAQAKGFVLQFQPRLALSDGALRAVQAQLRWPRRRGGISAPSALLPLLEESGLAASAEAWALQEACRAALGWDAAPVALALAGGSLRDGGLLDHIGRALAASRLQAERLEITLPAFALDVGGDDALLALAALRDRGVAVGLDAFGGSSACLMALMRLPLTAVKLDRCLVRDLPHNRDAAALARAAIDFAHTLGITTIATGLETAAQLKWLRQAGCDEAQGSLCGAASAEVRPGGSAPWTHVGAVRPQTPFV